MPFEPKQLTHDDIETKAEEVLEAFGFSSFPVSVEEIAEFHFGYDLVFTDEGLYKDPSFLGGICFDNNEIYVNTSIESHEGRLSFTVAHEIGHHVLHRNDYLKYLNGEFPEILCRDTSKRPLIEQQADQFAAALLMPRDYIKTLWGYGVITDVYKAYSIAQKFIKENSFDNVSTTAMVNRLIDLGYVSGVTYQSGSPKRSNRSSPLMAVKFKLFSLIKKFKFLK